MDIPDTGAVFTLGKSSLSSDDHQSYFFIKNDAVKKLIAGNNQSAVICESGRLFVWGENQFGQLGISSSTTITRPSCVKEFKNAGAKIKNLAFGEAFSIAVTNDDRAFFCGKKINENEFDAKPYEIFEFNDLKKKGFTIKDIRAGASHVAILTENGIAYGWGSNEYNQISKSAQKTFENPVKFNTVEIIVKINCSKNLTVLLTISNKFIIYGKYIDENFYQEIQSPDETLDYHINHFNDFYICGKNRVWKNFQAITLDEKNIERVIQISSGNEFLSYITESGRFFTTFEHKTFTEISKFASMTIVAISSGNSHILVHGIPKSMETIIEETLPEFKNQFDQFMKKSNDLLLIDTLKTPRETEDSDSSHPSSECTVKFVSYNDSEEENLKQIDRVVDLVRIKGIAGKLSPKAILSSDKEETIKIVDLSKGESYSVLTKDGELKQVELIRREDRINSPNEIRFIDNGIDVTDDVRKLEDSIRKRRKTEKLKIRGTKVAPSDNSNFIFEDKFLGERLSFIQKNELKDSKAETQRSLQLAFEEPHKRQIIAVKTPMPTRAQRTLSLNPFDIDSDEDRQTTASLVSDRNNPFENEYSDDNNSVNINKNSTIIKQKIASTANDIKSLSEKEEGKIKKLLREFKESSCKQLSAIRNGECCRICGDCCGAVRDQIKEEIEETNKRQAIEKQQEIQKSKVCNIL